MLPNAVPSLADSYDDDIQLRLESLSITELSALNDLSEEVFTDPEITGAKLLPGQPNCEAIEARTDLVLYALHNDKCAGIRQRNAKEFEIIQSAFQRLQILPEDSDGNSEKMTH